MNSKLLEKLRMQPGRSRGAGKPGPGFPQGSRRRLSFSRLLEKMRLHPGRKKGRTNHGTVFSQKLEQQPSYKARHLGDERSDRGKTILEKWQARRQQRKTEKSAWHEGGNSRKTSLQLLLLLSLFLLAGNMLLSGPLSTRFGGWDYFSIHEIEIKGCRIASPKGLRSYAGISYQMNMLTLEPETIKERLRKHPWVAEADIRRIWPDGLVITIREHHPQALLVEGDPETLKYVDSEGVVFSPVAPGQELDFPVITGLDAFHTDEERAQLIRSATTFLRLAQRNNPNLPAQNVSEIHFTGKGELVVYLVRHPFPIYFGRQEIKKKFYQLRKVLEVLYRKENGKAIIEKVAYIRMDYQDNKVLVVQNYPG